MSSLLKMMQKLGDLLYQISMKTKVSKSMRESFEDGLQSLIDESIKTIEKIESAYSTIGSFDIDEANEMVRDLIDDMSVFFQREKRARGSFSETERKSYDALTYNLAKLIKVSVDVKQKLHLKGLLTLDKASAERGRALLVESMRAFMKDVAKLI